MDINNPNIQTPVSNPQPTQPMAPQNPTKKVPWLAIGLIVAILIIGGSYLLLGTPGLPTTKKQPPLTITSQTPVTPAPENLENDLNAVNVENGVDSDFASIDQDLQQL